MNAIEEIIEEIQSKVQEFVARFAGPTIPPKQSNVYYIRNVEGYNHIVFMYMDFAPNNGPYDVTWMVKSDSSDSLNGLIQHWTWLVAVLQNPRFEPMPTKIYPIDFNTYKKLCIIYARTVSKSMDKSISSREILDSIGKIEASLKEEHPLPTTLFTEPTTEPKPSIISKPKMATSDNIYYKSPQSDAVMVFIYVDYTNPSVDQRSSPGKIVTTAIHNSDTLRELVEQIKSKQGSAYGVTREEALYYFSKGGHNENNRMPTSKEIELYESFLGPYTIEIVPGYTRIPD